MNLNWTSPGRIDPSSFKNDQTSQNQLEDNIKQEVDNFKVQNEPAQIEMNKKYLFLKLTLKLVKIKSYQVKCLKYTFLSIISLLILN